MPTPPPRRSDRPRVLDVAFFVAVFLASMWPIYPMASRIEPVILGLPFALVFLAGLGLLSFAGMLAMHVRDTKDDE